MRAIPIAATALLVASSAAAQNATDALARAQRAYEGLTTLSADFNQTIVNRMLGEPETSSGTIFLARPDRFAMRFVDPAGDRLVADGSWLWIYTPDTEPGQVIRQPIPTGGALSPNLFAQFVESPEQTYQTSYRGTDTIRGQTVDVVRLVPREPADFRWATISVARDSGLMLRLHIREGSGQDRTLDLVAVRPNDEIPPSELRFDVPEGTRVVIP